MKNKTFSAFCIVLLLCIWMAVYMTNVQPSFFVSILLLSMSAAITYVAYDLWYDEDEEFE